MRRRKSDCDKYCDGVLAGRVPAGALIRLACERYKRDLAESKERGIYFDRDAAEHASDFFKLLKHSKGEWAGLPLILAPWQEFIIYQLFGWQRRTDAKRRFRTAYIEVPRKNGKSTLLAGLGLYLFFADGEGGAEVYTAATKREQARIVHAEAIRMVQKSGLKNHVRIYRDNLHVEGTASKFEPVSSDAKTLDGLNIHGAIVDELHAHKTRNLWDVLETATGSREQPMIVSITTAGTDRESICYEQHEYSESILRGTIKDDTYFAFISTIDEGDDWRSEMTWRKANPNFGISVKPDDLQRKAEKAAQVPRAQNNFLCKHLDVWTQQVTRWIDLDLWLSQAEKIDESTLLGAECYGGLDLASTADINAWVMLFPDAADRDRVRVLSRFWVPEARLHDRRNRYAAQYQDWARRGYLDTIPGDAVDYGFIRDAIMEDVQRFNVIDINIDKLFQGAGLALEIADELDGIVNVFGMRQGFLSYGMPMKDFERRLKMRKINHNNHPVLNWMVGNVAVSEDAAGNIKPNKAESQGKIDGVCAMVMALERCMKNLEAINLYQSKGIEVF